MANTYIKDSKARPSDRLIPWVIVVFFAALTALLIWFVDLAYKTHTGVITEHAYDKGLKYNETIKMSEKQEHAPYKLSLTYEGKRIFFDFKDESGAPIVNKKVKLWLYRPSQKEMDQKRDMAFMPERGQYSVSTENLAKGLWEARVSVEHHSEYYQISKRVTIE